MSKRDSSSDKEEKAGLDLGLASLLSLQTEDAAAPPSPGIDELQSAAPQSAELSPLSILAAQSNWDELLKVSEYQLTVSQSTEARAWWVYAHLMRKSMPAAFLAAPFENLLLGSLSGISDNDRDLLSNVGSLLVERLTNADEKGLASVIREKLISQKLACTSKQIEGETDRGNEAVHLATMTGLQHLVTQASIEPLSTSRDAVALSGTPALVKRRPRMSLAIGGACAACMALGFVIFYRAELQNFTSLPVSVASEEFYSTPKQVELLNPELKRRDVVGSLTALFYSIDKTPAPENAPSVSKATTVPSDVKAPQGNPQQIISNLPSGPTPPDPTGQIAPSSINKDPSSDSPPQQASANQPSSLQPSAPTGVEKVKVDGPVEPQSVRERIQGRRELREKQPFWKETPRRDCNGYS